MSIIQETSEIPEDFWEARTQLCPGCQAPLDLHQPDPELGDRLLGICLECKDWFDVDGSGRIRGKLRSIGLRKS